MIEKELFEKYKNSDICIYTYNESIKNRLNCYNINYSLLQFIDKSKFEISEDFLDILILTIHKLKNPIFLFYLYDLDNKDKSNEFKERELLVIDKLVKDNQYVIVFTENKIRQYNYNVLRNF